jgi:LDH2 family malate/lactate/ureidoglycolate dehydrogenase
MTQPEERTTPAAPPESAPTTPVEPARREAFRRYDADELRRFAAECLVVCGMAAEEARIGADVLVDTDLMGIDSHGIAHLPGARSYVPGLRRGEVNPRAQPRIVRETASTALLDGDNGFGPVVGVRAMQLALAKARTAGSGSVAVTNSRHFGAAGYYALMAVPEGCIGLAMTNSGPWVAAAGGRGRMLGTNPIAVAAPAGSEQPFLIDLATSSVAVGKLEIAHREEKPIPPGWALDATGEPTRDIPTVFREGALAPLGSTLQTSSYKGYALALMVDLFTGILSGFGYSLALPLGGAGHFFAAWQIDAFLPAGEFTGMLDEMQRTFRTAAPAAGVERVLLPGQREFEARAERTAHGIPLHRSVSMSLEALAADLGVPPPRPR